MRSAMDDRCSGEWPAHPYGLPCTLPRGHRGPHQHGTRMWTDDEARSLSARAEDAARDAADRARAAVLKGQTAGPVAIGANRAQRRSGRRPNRR